MLQFGKNVFCYTILVEFGFNGLDNIVYHSTVDMRLKEILVLTPLRLLQQWVGEQLTTILFDISLQRCGQLATRGPTGVGCRGFRAKKAALLYLMQIQGNPT